MSMVHEGHQPAAASSDIDIDDPNVGRFELVRAGARRDGVEIVHYQPRFPVPGTKAERRVVRTIAFILTLSGLAAFGFVAAFIAWPWEYQPGSNLSKLYTPVLGLTMGLSLFLLGIGIITWSKKLFPEELAVQDRHDGPSPRDEQALTGATIMNLVDETGIRRRPMLKGALLLPALGLGVVAVAPLVGALIKSPNSPVPNLRTTGWDPSNNNGRKIRLVREDGSPIRPEEVSVGGQMTVYPGIPGGTTNKWADSPTLLIHLRQPDAETLRANLNSAGGSEAEERMWKNFVAYSKICTHAGCPASLYEQQTNRLLCPCHQSQFLITDQAKPIFGPATRRLPMLPIDLDEEGFLVATSDYLEPVGPAFWERPS